jgi:AcrR family transcriptional regulator
LSIQVRSKAKFASKREAMTQRLTDIALADGLSELVLLRAAKRLATSDRMLVYYFGTKSEIIHAVLTCISQRQSAMLAARSSGGPRSAKRVFEKAWTIVSDPKFVPFMRVWTEVVSRGSRGEEPYKTFGEQAISSWLAWLETRLAMPPGKARGRHAAAILTILFGATLLEMSHRRSTLGTVKLLGAGLGPFRN